MNKSELMEEYEKFILLPDRQAFEILLAGVASHFMDRAVPFWVLYVGASGSGKSTAIEIFAKHDRSLSLDSWTRATLLSGLDDIAPENQFINMHDNKVWLVSDLSEAISNPNDKGEIMSQLRRVYDGRLDRGHGSTKGESHWEGKITFVVGVTDAIDREPTFNRDNALGERFSRVNVRGNEARLEAAERAFDSRLSGRGNRVHLSQCADDFMDGVIDRACGYELFTPAWARSQLITLGDTSSQLRTPIIGEGGGGFEHMPEPEFGTRLAQQLGVLADTNCMLENRAELNAHDISLATRVAMDAVPRVRSRVLSALLNGAKNKAQISRFTHMPASTVNGVVDKLFALQVMDSSTTTIYPEWVTKLEASGLAHKLTTAFPPSVDTWRVKPTEVGETN